jgi:hypothetical protein
VRPIGRLSRRRKLSLHERVSHFLFPVQSVLSFVYPGKFETFEHRCYENSHLRSLVFQMWSDELDGCDKKLEAAVRALKANMHAVPSLAELAHECVVANGMVAALEGLQLAPL